MKQVNKMVSSETATTLHKIFTALFYALSSILIVVVNKVVLTTYK